MMGKGPLNPLNPPMYDLFYHLNTLNGLLFTLENQLKGFEKLYRDFISKSSIDISRIFSGNSSVGCAPRTMTRRAVPPQV